MNAKRMTVAVLALLLAGLVACGPGEPPDQAAARKLLDAKLRDPIARNEMRVKSFTKLGGSEMEDSRYGVDYRAEIECLKETAGATETLAVLAVQTRMDAQGGMVDFQYDKSQGPAVVCAFKFQQAVPHPTLTFRKAGGAWEGEP